MNTIQHSAVFDELGLSKSATGAKRGGDLGQKDFLKLMTTQLQNQDPFKPMESGDFLGQLAQFGAVTGIDDLNTAFKELASSMFSNQTFEAASMVGRNVLVPESSVRLEQDGQVAGAVDVPKAVANLKIGIYDQSGQLVRQIELGNTSSGMRVFNWDGLNKDGGAVPPGIYEVRAEALSGGTNEALEVLLSAEVKSVTLPKAGGSLTLELAGLGDADLSEVRQIR